MTKRLLLILALVAFVGTTVEAQSFMLGPQLGYFAPKEEGADGSMLFGAAARLKLGSLGVEGAINYRKEKTEFFGADIETTFFPVLVSGLLYPLPIIYGIAGVGWYNIKVEATGYEETSSEFGYHIGGGAELALGKIVLAADIKYIFLEYQFEEGGISTDYNADGFIINGTLFFPL